MSTRRMFEHNTRTQLAGLTPVASHVDIFFSPFPIFENIESEKWCDISEILLTAIRKNCIPTSSGKQNIINQE